MRIFYKQLALMLLLITSETAFALPFNSFDPRSMAMGGVGVAVGDPSTAPFFNPAILSSSDRKKKFAFELPIFGLSLSDPGNFRNNLSPLSDSITALQDSLTAVNASASSTATAAEISLLPSRMNTLATNINSVNNSLSALNNQPLQIELGAATLVALPGRNYGFAFFADAWGAFGGALEYNDGTTLTNLSSSVTAAANALSATTGAAAAACTAVQNGTGTTTDVATCLAAATNISASLIDAQGVVNFSTNTGITSKVHIRGVIVREMGVSLSHGYVSNDQVMSFGITPKYVQLTLYDALLAANAGGISGLTGDDYQAKYSDMSFDVGMTQRFRNGFRTGWVIKNVIEKTYDFKRAATAGGTPVATGAKLTIGPQLRAGISYEDEFVTVGLDGDLTQNSAVGLEQPSQFLGFGLEVRPTQWVQFRGGYRKDMLNVIKRDILSAGMGFTSKIPGFKPHFDFAVTTSPNFLETGFDKVNELGFSFRFGMNF